MDNVKVVVVNKNCSKVIIGDKEVVLTRNTKNKKPCKRFNKEKLVENILGIIIFLIVVGTFTYMFYDSMCKPYGYYAPDYINEEGVYVDIDGDGDVYHWVDPND